MKTNIQSHRNTIVVFDSPLRDIGSKIIANERDSEIESFA